MILSPLGKAPASDGVCNVPSVALTPMWYTDPVLSVFAAAKMPLVPASTLTHSLEEKGKEKSSDEAALAPAESISKMLFPSAAINLPAASFIRSGVSVPNVVGDEAEPKATVCGTFVVSLAM